MIRYVTDAMYYFIYNINEVQQNNKTMNHLSYIISSFYINFKFHKKPIIIICDSRL